MAKTLRVGIVGLGAVARVHLEAYRGLRAVEIVAAADLDPERVQFARSQLGLRAYGSIESLLQNESLDIACICTPPSAHERATELCAEAGVNVLCEKPLAVSTEACARMIGACQRRGVRLCYGASYRYLPALIRAREIILEGTLGDILLLRECVVGGAGAECRQTLSDAHYPAGGPGGSGTGLVDHGVHLIDAFAWLLSSRVTRAVGRGNISGDVQRPEYAHLEFANGAIAELIYEDGTFSTDLPHEGVFSAGAAWGVAGLMPAGSWHPHPGCIHVHGTRGALRIFYYANALYVISASGIREVTLEGRPMPGNFALQMESFAAAISSGQPAPVPGECGAEACRVLTEIYAQQVSRAAHPDECGTR